MGYADISNTAVLIEIARKKRDYVPELSFGTHFFQDLVEAQIHYLPLYPDDPGVLFNNRFFTGAVNQLPGLLPEYRDLSRVVRVIEPGEGKPRPTLEIFMDGDQEKAVGALLGA